jgi:SARP family transcriptional regulator, regulator of embCAB operon
MQLNLMGTLEILEDGQNLTPTAAKPRQVMAMLAVNANTMVSAEQLIDELWPQAPPASAKTAVQTYVYQLRKLLDHRLASLRGKEVLVTRPAGYVLTVPRDDVDIFRFQHLMKDGRNTLRRGDAPRAADLLRNALGLWRGPMLADVARGPSLDGRAVYLEEQRMEALSLRIEADLETRRHREIVGELRCLLTTHRLHEWIYVRLMQALYRSGRRGEALDVYQQLCRLLDDELGLEPSRDARQLHHQILSISC